MRELVQATNRADAPEPKLMEGPRQVQSISRYQFAADPRRARSLMRFYATMFPRGPVADLGVGRGFFLEALRDQGTDGVGVDISEEAAEHCRRLGFQITLSDASEYLATARGLGGVFVAHLIEHLEPAIAGGLLRHAFGALAPGGTIVLVTPNVKDLQVWTETFWLDLTHVRPYPAALLRVMLGAEGFRVEAMGHGQIGLGPRRIPAVLVGRVRYGLEYGRPEIWVRAVRP